MRALKRIGGDAMPTTCTRNNGRVTCLGVLLKRGDVGALQDGRQQNTVRYTHHASDGSPRQSSIRMRRSFTKLNASFHASSTPEASPLLDSGNAVKDVRIAST